VRSIEEVRKVGELVATGLNDCEIERLTRIPRGTVRDWRHARRWEQPSIAAATRSCERCGAPAHNHEELPAEYVYLLGMYLGDGHIVLWRKRVYRS
jgi:hypothetical protein